MASKHCMCGSQRFFKDCCGPYLAGESLAPTAEALMRSRYSAFYQGDIGHLIATHPCVTPEAEERQTLAKTVKSTRWVNLLIVKTQKGKAKDKLGVVVFVAAFQPVDSLLSVEPAGKLAQLHEKARFIKVNDRWLYTNGDILPPYQPKPTQRCWCGSRKAFKHCHAQSR